jgi:hypothetical protein
MREHNVCYDERVCRVRAHECKLIQLARFLFFFINEIGTILCPFIKKNLASRTCKLSHKHNSYFQHKHIANVK